MKHRQANSKWYIGVELPRDNQGNRRQHREAFRTRAEAERRLQELIGESERGLDAPHSITPADTMDTA